MRILFVTLLALTGCATTYHVERHDNVLDVTTTLDVRSYREFPGGIQVRYNRETGEFELEAGEVRNGDAMAEVVLGLLPLIQEIPQ